MKKKILIVSIAIITAVSLAALGQSGLTTERSAVFLNRQVSIARNKSATSAAFFKAALISAKTSGGIAALPTCNSPVLYPLAPADASLRGALDAIVAAEPQYKWVVEDDVINVLPRNQDLAFLDIRIAKVKIENAKTVHEALEQLLASPELQKGVARLNSGSRLYRGGLGYFDSSDEDKSENPLRISISAENITVREALNDIARAHGSAIWSYTEHHCGKDAFSLDFLVR